ncbi:hypothetical protein P43SY_003256 [Pythium insidiosum]|uniref:Transmembrane protein n=1 Tax=Pythium insidiosum TaxID=114742 RepID=A0AAD5LUE5_PYTIN|nr:hypothetical protein P43SY_003256 [Pythium insidiosum]
MRPLQMTVPTKASLTGVSTRVASVWRKLVSDGQSTDVSPVVFRVVWGAVVLLHLGCATFVCIVGSLYLILPVQAPTLVDNIELYTIAVPRKHFKTIATFYFLVAACHLYFVAWILYYSVRQQRLLLDHPPRRRASLSGPSTRLGSSATPLALSKMSSASFRVARRLAPAPESLVRRRASRAVSLAKPVVAAFDVTDRNYEFVYILRELVQNAIQTHQAYRSSYLVARPWMNNMIVLLLVANAWATPLIQFTTLKTSVARSRLLCLVINLALDITSYVVFPIALFLPYYADFNPVRGNFDLRFWYTDRWLTLVINEWQMLFVTSFWDGVSKILITFNVVRALQAIPKLVRPRETSMLARIAVAPSSFTTQPTTRNLRDEGVAMTQDAVPAKASTSAFERLGRLFLVVLGAAVLGLHAYALSHGNNTRCMLQVRPWLARRAVCSLMDINCQRSGGDGGAEDFDRAIDSVDPQWLSSLIVRHCSAVEITPRFKQLRGLLGFKMYNASLVRWDMDAALTAKEHPRVMYVFLVATDMIEFPKGLYAQDFPPLLLDIEICRTNLSVLPPELAARWPVGLFLVLEEFRFTAFPDVLVDMRPQYLSLAMNTLTSIPAAFWSSDELYFLNINGNPVVSMPPSINTTPPLTYFRLLGTQIADLPDWVNVDAARRVAAGQTPLCDTLNQLNSAQISDPHWLRLHRAVDCTPPRDPLNLYHFPIRDEPTNNP